MVSQWASEPVNSEPVSQWSSDPVMPLNWKSSCGTMRMILFSPLFSSGRGNEVIIYCRGHGYLIGGVMAHISRKMNVVEQEQACTTRCHDAMMPWCHDAVGGLDWQDHRGHRRLGTRLSSKEQKTDWGLGQSAWRHRRFSPSSVQNESIRGHANAHMHRMRLSWLACDGRGCRDPETPNPRP